MNVSNLTLAKTNDLLAELRSRVYDVAKPEVHRIYLDPLTIPIWALGKPSGYLFGSTRRVYLTSPKSSIGSDRHFIIAVCRETDNNLVVHIEHNLGSNNSWGRQEHVELDPHDQCNLNKLMGNECAARFTVNGIMVEVWF